MRERQQKIKKKRRKKLNLCPHRIEAKEEAASTATVQHKVACGNSVSNLPNPLFLPPSLSRFLVATPSDDQKIAITVRRISQCARLARGLEIQSQFPLWQILPRHHLPRPVWHSNCSPCLIRSGFYFIYSFIRETLSISQTFVKM